jgi:hypothetical protein
VIVGNISIASADDVGALDPEVCHHRRGVVGHPLVGDRAVGAVQQDERLALAVDLEIRVEIVDGRVSGCQRVLVRHLASIETHGCSFRFVVDRGPVPSTRRLGNDAYQPPRFASERGEFDAGIDFDVDQA